MMTDGHKFYLDMRAKGTKIRILDEPSYRRPFIHVFEDAMKKVHPHQKVDCPMCESEKTKREIGALVGGGKTQVMMNVLATTPKRVHKRKRWDRSGSYHRRVQKKWMKRFGSLSNSAVMIMPNNMLKKISESLNFKGMVFMDETNHFPEGDSGPGNS